MSRLLSFSLLFLWACSSEPQHPDPAAGGGAPSGNAGYGGEHAAGEAGEGGAAFEPAACERGPGVVSETFPVEVGAVHGRVVDLEGEPAAGLLVQVCGKDVCLNGESDDTGDVRVSPGQRIDAPAFKYGTGLDFAKLVFPIEGGDEIDLGTVRAVRLPPYEEGARFVPGTVVRSNGVSLALAPNANVRVDLLVYEDASQHVFRATRIPTDGSVAAVGDRFDVAYAFGPVETRLCPAPELRIENEARLASGARLELYVLGLDVDEEFAPYAGWEKVGEGTVSDDGAELVFPEGVPLLTAAGVRVVP